MDLFLIYGKDNRKVDGLMLGEMDQWWHCGGGRSATVPAPTRQQPQSIRPTEREEEAPPPLQSQSLQEKHSLHQRPRSKLHSYIWEHVKAKASTDVDEGPLEYIMPGRARFYKYISVQLP